MNDRDWFADARRLTRDEFASANPYWFLVGRRQMLPQRRSTGLFGAVRADTGERTGDDIVIASDRTVPLTLVRAICKPDGSTTDAITVGRTNTDVIIPEALISRNHAVINVHPDHVVLQDLRSANGTFVDDQPLGVAPRKVVSGSLVRFSHVEFELVDAAVAWDRIRSGPG